MSTLRQGRIHRTAVTVLLALVAGLSCGTRAAAADEAHSGAHDHRGGPGRGIGYEGVGHGQGHSTGAGGHSGSALEDEVFRGQRRGSGADQSHGEGDDAAGHEEGDHEDHAHDEEAENSPDGGQGSTR